MSHPVLLAIDEEIKNRMDVVDKLNATIEAELNKIQTLKNARNSIAETMNDIVPVEKHSATNETVSDVVSVEKPSAPALAENVHVIMSVEKPSAPAVAETVHVIVPVEKPSAQIETVETSAVKQSSLDKLIKTLGVKSSTHSVVVKTLASIVKESNDSSSVLDQKSANNSKTSKKSKLSSVNYVSDDKKLLDTSFKFGYQFVVKFSKESNSTFNIFNDGNLVYWKKENGEYSSTYEAGKNKSEDKTFLPYDPFKASLYGSNGEVKPGMLFFIQKPKHDESNQVLSNETKSFKRIDSDFPHLVLEK